MFDNETLCQAQSHTDGIIRCVCLPNRVEVSLLANTLQATLLTCGDITPGTDQASAISQHDDQSESAANYEFPQFPSPFRVPLDLPGSGGIGCHVDLRPSGNHYEITAVRSLAA